MHELGNVFVAVLRVVFRLGYALCEPSFRAFTIVEKVVRWLGVYTSTRIIVRALTLTLNILTINRRSRVFSPPGGIARRVLAFLFSKKDFDIVFAQAIIDMREEHAEALANRYLWKARWIVFRDHLGLGLTVGAYLVASAGKKVGGLWKMIP